MSGKGVELGRRRWLGGQSCFFEFMSTIHTRILERRVSFDASLDAILK